MKNHVKSFVFVLMLTFSVSAVFSQHENIWLGGKSGNNADWFVASNWSKHRIPNALDKVVIPANTPFPVVSGTAVVQSLYMESGSEIQFLDRAVLVIMHDKGSGKGFYLTGIPSGSEMQFGLNATCELVLYQGVRDPNAKTCPLK